MPVTPRAVMAIAETDRPPAYLLVANPDADTVTVLDVETGKLVALVQVGSEPRQIVITPDNEYALVLNEKSGDMAVIRIFTLGGNQVGGDRVKRYKSAPLFTMIPVGERPVSARGCRLNLKAEVAPRRSGLPRVSGGRQLEEYESARRASSLRRLAAMLVLIAVLAADWASSKVAATPRSPWSVDQWNSRRWSSSETL